ncbi:MAG TPA: NEW3 domain-containing protein [Acidimicrobiales bacterium]|nr:NEW3 domain-containing protein [Acidimicrobiales bacterium]
MKITAVESTYCFVDQGQGLYQVVRVTVEGARRDVEAEVHAHGPGGEDSVWRGRLDPTQAGQPGGPAWAPSADPGLRLAPGYNSGPGPVPDGVVVEVAAIAAGSHPAGSEVPLQVRARAGRSVAEAQATVVAREPGWRMLMVPHFHYDPVWWNTQAGYTSGWDELMWAHDRRESFQHSGLSLVEAHLERARASRAYKFVLAEVDYLKPFWDLYPDRRAELRALLKAGRLEIVGGTYNEPNTNLTGAETAVRAAVYGLGFQRDVLGAQPATAWQLDVFGHDPQFPGIMADCGLTSSAWARGPFHQWGPSHDTGSTGWMQFPSEFEWVAPNGRSLLTCYMALHYSAGWDLERALTAEGAMWRAYQLFEGLAQVSAVPVVLLPVGTDYAPPSRWLADIVTRWQQRYAWPRFEVGLPREFFAAVRDELAARGRAPTPQSRDMGPVYTGKDVSYIDTKQAQRSAEAELAEAEAMAALASVLGASVPYRALDKAWRQVVFGAHHDGITGSESDQVYLDLLAGWREAYELARSVAEGSREVLLGHLAGEGDGDAVIVTNTTGLECLDLVELDLAGAAAAPGTLAVRDSNGGAVPAVRSAGRTAEHRLQFLAEVPAFGYNTYRLVAGAEAGEWERSEGCVAENEFFEVRADPIQGGGLVAVRHRGAGLDLVPAGEVANELLVYAEYSEHPRYREGPWHLSPSGPPARSRSGPATVWREASPAGQRVVAEGELAGFRYRQVVTLWAGLERVELSTEIHGWAKADHLLRLRVPTTLAGGSAVSAVGDAAIGRSFALLDVDSAVHPWTLDSPAAEWFGVGPNLVLEAGPRPGRDGHSQSVGVAEVIVPDGAEAAPWARQLVVALLQQGVTATCSRAGANRYGALLGDSNLPDFRIAAGGPGDNAFVAGVLAAADPCYQAELDDQLARQGWAHVLVPAAKALAELWQPGADLRGPRDLGVLVVAGAGADGTGQAAERLASAVETGRVHVAQPEALVPSPGKVPAWTAAMFNRGTPGFAVDVAGALHVSLLRACTGWPSGVWIDPPRRSAPDGSGFALQHWSHRFEHALFLGAGDWREAGCVPAAQAYNRALRASASSAQPAPVPGRASLLSLPSSGRGRVVVAALKPAGNPLASSDDPARAAPAATNELTLRAYEASGQPATARLATVWPLQRAQLSDMAEREERGELAVEATGPERSTSVELGRCEIATLRLSFAGVVGEGAATANSPAGDQVPVVAGAERAEPVFSRYWLHNKGAAPMGNQAVAVHLLTVSAVARPGDHVEVVAQVSSGAARTTQAGSVEVVVPPGWGASPKAKPYSLAPRAYMQEPVQVSVPPKCQPGRYFVAARTTDAAGQCQEDVMTVDVVARLAPPGGDGQLPARFAHPGSQAAAELEADLEEAQLVVAPGASAEMALLVANHTQGELRGEVQLVSPLETWPLLGPWAQALRVPPRGKARVHARVTAPLEGGLETWALFKVCYFGRLWYSPAVSLRLGDL